MGGSTTAKGGSRRVEWDARKTIVEKKKSENGDHLKTAKQ